MKRIGFAFICLIGGLSIKLNAAPEAWLLEMPEQHATYLVEASQKENPADYKAVLERIPALLQQGAILEVERFVRSGPEDKETKLEGQLIPKIVHHFEGREHASGSDYSGRGDFAELRLMLRQTEEGMPHLRLMSFRASSSVWMPTLTWSRGDRQLRTLRAGCRLCSRARAGEGEVELRSFLSRRRSGAGGMVGLWQGASAGLMGGR